MKTYYDLTNKEKSKYIDEFKKTPGGKDLFGWRAFFIILTAIILVVVVALSIYEEEAKIVISEMELIENFCGFIIGLTIVYSIYLNINFTGWLKNKYDIKRW